MAIDCIQQPKHQGFSLPLYQPIYTNHLINPKSNFLISVRFPEKEKYVIISRCYDSLRISDILKLTVGDLRDIKPGETLKVKEMKTGKINILMINKSVHEVLHQYLDEVKPSDEDYLFRSRNGNNRPLTRETVNKMIKEWTRSFKGNYGTHTLRKTFGYIQRTKYGVSFEVLCKRFGHLSPSITMRYLGIDDKEVKGILLNEI